MSRPRFVKCSRPVCLNDWNIKKGKENDKNHLTSKMKSWQKEKERTVLIARILNGDEQPNKNSLSLCQSHPYELWIIGFAKKKNRLVYKIANIYMALVTLMMKAYRGTQVYVGVAPHSAISILTSIKKK